MKSKSLDCAIMKSIRTALIFPARTEVIKCESMFILKTDPPRVICTEPRIKELAVFKSQLYSQILLTHSDFVAEVFLTPVLS